MPIHENPRWEKFAQGLFEGRTADESYALAGYKPNDGNCIRLKGNERVKARLAELQAQAARKSEVTVQSLLDELEHARSRADGLDQLSAAVKAISEKAKISGLLVQKVEIGPAGAFDEAETYADLADKMLGELETRFRPVTEADREGLTELIERQASELGEFLASIRARPVNGLPENPTNVIAREAQALRRQRLGNGQRRLIMAPNGGALD